MQRLWVRWTLLIAFVAVLGVVFINLGQWQLDRLNQRQARNVTTLANEKNPVRPVAEVFTHPIQDGDQWQRVEAQGTFDAEHQFIARYRSAGDVDGYEVITPLRTGSGVVLVDRGLLPLPSGVRSRLLRPRRRRARSPWSVTCAATSRAGAAPSPRSISRCA